MRRLALVLLALALTPPAALRAGDGDLDTSFFATGKVAVTSGLLGNYFVRNAGLGPDGQHYWWAVDHTIPTGGESSVGYFAYVSMKTNGSLFFDCNFLPPGAVQSSVHLSDGAFDAQGRLVLLGTADIDAGGGAIVHAVAMTRIPSALSGCTGTTDASFDSGGHPGWSIYSFPGKVEHPRLALDRLGGIDVVGTMWQGANDTDVFVTRYLSTGVLDPGFAPGTGFVTFDGTGAFDNGLAVAVSEDPVGTLHVWAAGYLLWTGGRTDKDSFVARLSVAGAVESAVTLDLSGGTANDDLQAATWDEASGELYVAGSEWTGTKTRATIARLTGAGVLDPSFAAPAGVLAFPFNVIDSAGDSSIAAALALTSDGRPVVAGPFKPASGAGAWDMGAARLTPDGLLDSTFHGTGRNVVAFDMGGTNWDIATTLSLSGNRPLLGGWIAQFDGSVKAGLARLQNPHIFADNFEAGVGNWSAMH